MDDKKVQRLFLLGTALEMAHMGEQWFLGPGISLRDLQEAFAGLAGFAGSAERGVELIVSVIVLLWFGSVYCVLRGGVWQKVALAGFSVVFLYELHHPIRSILNAAYGPGTATGVALFVAGVTLLKEVLRRKAA